MIKKYYDLRRDFQKSKDKRDLNNLEQLYLIAKKLQENSIFKKVVPEVDEFLDEIEIEIERWGGTIPQEENEMDEIEEISEEVIEEVDAQETTKESETEFILKYKDERVEYSNRYLKSFLDEAEKDAITLALKFFKYNKAKTSRYLGISREALRCKINKLF